MNRQYAPNFMRSTMAPEIRAGVMMANVIWNSMKIALGTVGAAAMGVASEPAFRPM